MGKPPVTRHWLRENAANRSPWRVLVFDTETMPPAPDRPDDHVLRLWCGRLTRRKDLDPKLPRSEDARGRTAAELADWIETVSKRDRTLWVFAHNLSFDLAVTALPVELTERGWRITEGALTSDSPWCRMSKGSRRITLADTWSWMPAGLADIGSMIGQAKPPLPAVDGDDAEWWHRCESDVAITSDAILSIMDWWDDRQLGNWSVTGPACGWSTYRHRRPAPRVLIDPDEGARVAEARAISGGRRDVRRVGQLPIGLYADLDLTTAHLTVMTSCPLPARRFGSFDHLDLADPILDSAIFDVMAECELEVSTPRYPWDSGHGVFYPVGRFRSMLAGPEIREARRRGELRSIGPGRKYHVRAHMRDWGMWLASLLDAGTEGVPPAVRLMAKHWSRCVPGKWASHTSDVLRRTPSPLPGWSVERGAVDNGTRHADFLQVGGELWTIARDMWADDAFPAILAWIQSYTRVAVGRLLDALGDSWVSVNTDGAVVDVLDLARLRGDGPDHMGTGSQWLLRWLDEWCAGMDATLDPFRVRIKGAWDRVTVYGPQHLVLGNERRLSGIPRRAVPLGNGAFAFTSWPRLRVQLRPDQGALYRTQERRVQLGEIPPHGWLLETGRVVPAYVRPNGDGRAHALGPSSDAWTAGTLADLSRQHPVLQRAATAALDAPAAIVA